MKLVLPEERRGWSEVVRCALEAERKRQRIPRSIESWYFVNRFREVQKGLAPGSILDVGCAEGLFCTELALAGRTATALDIDPIFTQYVHEKAALNHLPIECIQADATILPLMDGSYDNIILGEILEHQFSPRAVLQEARRVLRPDGRVIITTPVYPFFAQRSFLQWEQGQGGLLGEVPEDKSPDCHVFEFTPQELVLLAEGMGFELVSFTFVDTRMWESRLRRFKERAHLPNWFYSLLDRILIQVNKWVGRQRLPTPLRVRHMVVVLCLGNPDKRA
jgi:SAM-dependent methyltransferase